MSLIPLMIPPSAGAIRWLPTHDATKRALELHAEELELTRRHAESVRVGHHATPVEQNQDAVFAVEHRVNQFVDPLRINTKRLSQSHDPTLPSEGIEPFKARDRRNLSSPARAPNMADASAQRAAASTCGHSSSQRSAVGSERRRRSCVTIASCHAMRRARSDTASTVSVPKSAIAYGFISNHP